MAQRERRVTVWSRAGILFGAQRYHDRYLSDLHFDNRYVTEYFRKVDARRRHRGSQYLLPLRRAEKLQLVEVVPWIEPC